MRRQLVALQRGFCYECQEHGAIAHLKENVMPRLLANDPQAQDRSVEAFRSLEVIGIDGGFDKGLDLQARASLNLDDSVFAAYFRLTLSYVPNKTANFVEVKAH